MMTRGRAIACSLLLSMLILSTVCDEIPVARPSTIECHVGFVTSYGDPKLHWMRLRQHYLNCTHIMGNLELKFLDDPNIDYDLTFLENVTYVSGYVAIYANNFPKVVQLPKLQVIRGNETFRTDTYSAALLIAANDHRQIYMPNLKEISSGDIYIDLETSSKLCYLDTIDWSSIVRNGDVHTRPRTSGSPSKTCPPCSRACETENWGKRCWGSTDDLCQWPPESRECDTECDSRCSVDDRDTCCHEQCAIGCTGPSARDCMECKDFKMADGTCVSHCPFDPPSFPFGRDCILAR